jgi:probable phosphoglycerate mutase
MLTRVVLIAAGPTPWDVEGRLVGSRPLPLTAEALDAIQHLLESLSPPVHSVYRAADNEASDQTARLVAKHFNLRVRDNPALDGLQLGLWEGLTAEEVRFRFPTVFQQWLENPLAVVPPDGEPLTSAIDRTHEALARILRRNRGQSIVLALRRRVMQIAIGVLRGESPQIIAGHLHEELPIATIELAPGDLKKIVG